MLHESRHPECFFNSPSPFSCLHSEPVRRVRITFSGFLSRGWTCTVENVWQSNGVWLLLEGKSLVCRKSGERVEKRLDLVCTDHDPTIRKRSRPVQRAGLYLDETRPESTPFLRLGCQTVVRRLY